MQIERYRSMTGEERVLAAIELSEQLLDITLEGICRRHPDYTSEDARLALARLRLGDDLFRAAWPHAPLLDA